MSAGFSHPYHRTRPRAVGFDPREAHPKTSRAKRGAFRPTDHINAVERARHPTAYCDPRYIVVYTSAAQERAMAMPRKETPISMRFRDDDLTIIDRGAELLGLSRTEFMRRAALHEAQAAILNETVIRVSPDTYDAFMNAISAPAAAPSPKAAERLRRSAPWDR